MIDTSTNKIVATIEGRQTAVEHSDYAGLAENSTSPTAARIPFRSATNTKIKDIPVVKRPWGVVIR